MRKKVVVDCRLWGLKHAGIGRYTQNIVEGIEKIVNPSDMEIIPLRFPVKHYTVKEQIIMPRLLHASRPDLVHFPHFNVPLFWSGSFVVTIHDLLWHERIGFSATTLPNWLYLSKYAGYRAVFRHAVLGSKAIIVPSNWVKQQLVKRYPCLEKKISVIYEGVSSSYLNGVPGTESHADLHRYQITPLKYLIYTGSLYPHKNVSIIFNVLKHYSRDLKLVVVCARNVFWERFRQEVAKQGLGGQVVLAGFVPDVELAGLYKHALAFVFPSLSEGFGLPGLEAMAAGCPVISSSAGSLPEIYDKAALYFDPTSGEDLVKKIKIIKDEKEMRKRMIALGKQWVTQFSWEKCAEQTLSVYKQVLLS